MKSNFRRNNKSSTPLFGLFIFAICLYLIIISPNIFNFTSDTSCPIEGPKSSAPLNHFEFIANVERSIKMLRKLHPNDLAVIITSVNNEAAKYNLPSFIESCQSVVPSIKSLLVFCLDSSACMRCKLLYDESFCIYMNLGISEVSLAPGGSDKLNRDYWKLTYGRMYANLIVHRQAVNALTVDVDSVFLQNPFSVGNGLKDRPNDIAVVADIRPFTFQYGDKTPINGGFIYFPGIDAVAASFSRQVLEAVWTKNCHPERNEQLVTSSVLRRLVKKYRANDLFNPHMLPSEQYVNFCSATCGDSNFKSIRSIDDLYRLEQQPHWQCDATARKKWVFFHAACLHWNISDKLILSRKKSSVQRAILTWVRETQPQQE